MYEIDFTESFTVTVTTAGGEIASLDLDADLVAGYASYGIRRFSDQEQAISKLVTHALSLRAKKASESLGGIVSDPDTGERVWTTNTDLLRGLAIEPSTEAEAWKAEATKTASRV